MEFFNLNQIENMLAAGIRIGASALVFLLLLFWIVAWKGYALWTAAKRGEKWWFMALLVVNTISLLEIFYLLKIAKKKEEIIFFLKKKIVRL